MRSIRTGIRLVLCLFLLLSCAKREVVRGHEPEPFAGPVTVETLKSAIGFGAVKSLKSLVEVEMYRHGERTGGASGVLGYVAPGRMRLNLFGPFGLTVTDFLMADGLLQLYFPTKNTLYEGASPLRSFNDLLDDRSTYSIEEDGELLILASARRTSEEGDLVTRYYFDRTYLLNRAVHLSRDDEEVMAMDLADFNGRVPQRAKVVLKNGTVIDIALRDPEFDTDVPAEYFKHIEHGDKKVLPLQKFLRRLEPKR